MYSPREVVLRFSIDHKKLRQFGLYLEASRDKMVTNTSHPWTHACVTLGPSMKIQGSTKFFDLLTGKIVVQRTMEEIPMSVRIVKLVNKWGKSSRNIQYIIKLVFLKCHKEKYN